MFSNRDCTTECVKDDHELKVLCGEANATVEDVRSVIRVSCKYLPGHKWHDMSLEAGAIQKRQGHI